MVWSGLLLVRFLLAILIANVYALSRRAGVDVVLVAFAFAGSCIIPVLTDVYALSGRAGVDVILVAVTPAGTCVGLGVRVTTRKGRCTDGASHGYRSNGDCNSFVDRHKLRTLLGTTPPYQTSF